MAYRLLLTFAARTDLDRIKAWYSQSGAGSAARQRVRQLQAAIGALEDAPHRWRRLEDGFSRLLISQGHRVVYRLTPDQGRDGAGTIIIVRVLGPGQES